MDNHAYQPDDNQRNNNQGNFGNVGNGRPFTVERQPSRSDRNDYLVPVNSRAKLFKQPYFYKRLSILFLLLAVLFLILMIIFIVLYKNSKDNLCLTNECLRTASNYLLSIDDSVDPCENFYQFACGRWSEEHPNHGWWNSFSSFTTISEKIALESLNALTEESDDIDEPMAVNKSRNFFKSCMDLGNSNRIKRIESSKHLLLNPLTTIIQRNSDSLNDLGISSIYPVLAKMGLPLIPTYITTSGSNKYKFDWLKVDALVKNVLLMDVFIGAAVGQNIYNGSENVLYIGLAYQTSPLPSPAKMKRKPFKRTIVKKDNDNDDSSYEELTRTVQTNIISYVLTTVVLNLTGKAPDEALLEKAADVIIDISNFVDEAITNTTDPDISEEDQFTITVEKLEKEINADLQIPKKDFLMTYLKFLFNNTNVTIKSDEVVIVAELDIVFLKIIVKYLNDIPDVNIELYMWWATVYAMIINTSDDISEYVTKQLSVFATDDQEIVRSRSLECALLVTNYMGYAVSYMLADQTFPNTTKPKVERMVRGIKNAFVKSVNQITWMDSKTKKVTLEKSNEMITFIGYPDWLFEKGELDKHYGDIIINPDTYLKNMVNIITSETKKNLKSLREVHKRDWYSEPMEVNAYNSFSDNAINIPIAILNFPMYHLGLEVLNYGSIGSILGHELTHGFDNTGRKHDKYGNFVQWWTNQTIETFENLTDCFIKQYDNFIIEGTENHVNGKKTLGENLADNGGLNQAFEAYKDYIAKYGDEPKLPGFQKYTVFQIFFIAYASIWCETLSAEDLANQIEYDEHCPNFIRVIGSLQNSKDFAEVFQCPLGSPMNPKEKCKIW